jgi:flavin-dependent dehydrogenase
MRHLIARLQGLASRAGATLMGEQRLLGWSLGTERVELHTAAGRLTCRWVVDAAGLKGAGLLESPKVAAEDICAAAQEVRLVRDPQQAAAWVREQGAELGHTLCFSSVAGGYSIINACVEEGEPWTVSLLTGCMPATAGISGAELLRRFVQEQAWIGEPLFGGSRPIPVGRPQMRLDEGPLMRVGDAAGQVYASHGSGVAMGMLAGDLLAQVLAEGGRPWDYTWRWQRRWGPLLFSSALFARHSRSLNAAITGEMMRQGVITPGLMGQALLQRPARPNAADLRQLALATVSAPRLIAAQLPTLARMSLVEAHCARFPQDPSGLSRWTRTLDSIWS